MTEFPGRLKIEPVSLHNAYTTVNTCARSNERGAIFDAPAPPLIHMHMHAFYHLIRANSDTQEIGTYNSLPNAHAMNMMSFLKNTLFDIHSII